MNCNVCDGTGWKITGKGAVSCECRKRRIAQSQAGTPLTPHAISQAVEAIGESLAFFPKGIAGRMLIGDAIGSMCSTVEQVRHMARRAVALYTSWDKCGVPGLRQIVCSAGIPADGVTLSITEAYPEGVPAEKPQQPAVLALPSGRPVTAELGMNGAVVNLAKAKAIQAVKPSRVVECPVTQADVDREIEKLRTVPR